MKTSTILLVLFAASAWTQSTEELRTLMRRSLQGLEESERRKEHYSYVRRDEKKQFHSNGGVKSAEIWVVQREFRDGVTIGRLLERDGKPLSPEEKNLQEERIRKFIAEVKAKTPAQLQKEREEREKNRKKDNDEDEWIKEFPEALDCKLLGEEAIAGRPALLLSVSPRPGYQPKNMRARVFEKIRGKMWIDKSDSQLVKADAEVFETVNIGLGIVGRVEKGTRFLLQRTKVGNDWLPQSEFMRFAARFLLFKSLNNEVSEQYSDYRPRASASAAN